MEQSNVGGKKGGIKTISGRNQLGKKLPNLYSPELCKFSILVVIPMVHPVVQKSSEITICTYFWGTNIPRGCFLSYYQSYDDPQTSSVITSQVLNIT